MCPIACLEGRQDLGGRLFGRAWGTYCDRRQLTTGLMLVVVLISIVLSIYLIVTG
jgi:hypothetical protein